MTEDMKKNLADLDAMFKEGKINADEYKMIKAQITESDSSEEELPSIPQEVPPMPPVEAPSQTENTEAPPPASKPKPVSEPKPPVKPKYHVSANGQDLGVFKTDDIIEKILSGEYDRDTLVWKNGMADWVKACELPDFEKHFPDGPPPIPGPSSKKTKPAAAAKPPTKNSKNEAAVLKVTKAGTGFIGEAKITGIVTVTDSDKWERGNKKNTIIAGDNFEIKILDCVWDRGKTYSFYLNKSCKELGIKTGDKLIIKVNNT